MASNAGTVAANSFRLGRDATPTPGKVIKMLGEHARVVTRAAVVEDERRNPAEWILLTQ